MNIVLVVKIILMLKKVNSSRTLSESNLMTILTDNEKGSKMLSLVSFAKAKSTLEELLANFIYGDQDISS